LDHFSKESELVSISKKNIKNQKYLENLSRSELKKSVKKVKLNRYDKNESIDNSEKINDILENNSLNFHEKLKNGFSQLKIEIPQQNQFLTGPRIKSLSNEKIQFKASEIKSSSEIPSIIGDRPVHLISPQTIKNEFSEYDHSHFPIQFSPMYFPLFS